jgi:predicted transcriptional regulator
MRLSEFCNRNVIITDRDTGIVEAARLMREQHVGNLVVVDREADCNRPVGIITDRDLVVEVLAEGVALDELTVGDVMTEDLATAYEDAEVLETLGRMRVAGVRRMPVIDRAGALKGIVAVDDLLQLLTESMNDVIGLIVREIKTEVDLRS